MVENTSKVFQQEGMEEYQSLDLFAVFALIAGLLSAGVLVSNVFLFIAFVAIVCGLISFLRILTSGGILTGTWIAGLGIGFALMFGAFQFSYQHFRKQTIHAASREHSIRWLNLLREGRLNEAHQLGMRFDERQIPGTDLDKYYRKTEVFDNGTEILETGGDLSKNMSGTPYEQQIDYFNRATLQKIIKLGTDCEIKFVRTLISLKEKNVDYVNQEFDLIYEKEGKEVKEKFDLVMMRVDHGKTFGIHWVVDKIDQEAIKVNRKRKR